jgi:hypothetical protein
LPGHGDVVGAGQQQREGHGLRVTVEPVRLSV